MFFWKKAAAPIRGQSIHRNAFASAVSITIWKRSVRIPIITPSLRCSATGRLAIIIRRRPLNGPGNCSRMFGNCPKTSFTPRCIPMTMRRLKSGELKRISIRSIFFVLARKIISGRWALPVPVAPVPKSILTGVRNSATVIPMARSASSTQVAPVISSFGILFLFSTTAMRMAIYILCHENMWIRAPALSGWLPYYRINHPIMTRMFLPDSLTRSVYFAERPICNPGSRRLTGLLPTMCAC